jgi:hypothetical protein
LITATLSYLPLWLRYFGAVTLVQEKESNHMVQIFALQVPLPWICCRSECRSFLLLLKVCARQISCTTQNVQIRGTFDNLAWARVLFSRNFQIFPAFCAWSLQPVSIERLCLEVKVLPALKAKGYPWHETVDHVTYVYFWYLLII